MAPSKNRGPFYFYMLKRKPELEKKLGRRLKMEEMPSLVHMEWKELPAKEKEKFSKMSDDSKSDAVKLDSRGIPLSQIQAEQKNAEIREENMKKEIVATVSAYRHGKGIPNARFYVVAIQYYGQLEDRTKHYLPAEVGIVQFSFREGIISEFHKIIKANFPIGYQHEINDYSQRTHNLFAHRENEIFKNNSINPAGLIPAVLSKFSKKSDAPIILYAQEQHRDVAIDVLERDNSRIKIYSLDFLYQKLYNLSCAEDEIPYSIAKDALMSCFYEYNPYPACLYHQKFLMDNLNYCAMSEAKRCVYNMCRNIDIKNRFGIEPVIGKHIPEDLPATGNIDTFELQPAEFDTGYNSSSKMNRNKEMASSKVSYLEDEGISDLESLKLDDKKDPWYAATQNINGAWMQPPVGDMNTQSEEEFPSLGSFTRHSATKGKEDDAAATAAVCKPKGVTYASVGLPGFGRGKTYKKK